MAWPTVASVELSSAPSVDRKPASTVREARRLETRARLYDAALAEISGRGLAAADVSAIAAAAGVVRGTFYFHFPTKEHVLVEAERNEEARIVSELGDAKGDLASVLSQLVHHVLAAERRLGEVVFRDMLGLHFSSNSPVLDDLAQHPLALFLVDVIGREQRNGHVSSSAAATELATFFLTGLFALLATGAHDAALLRRYVATIVNGMETR